MNCFECHKPCELSNPLGYCLKENPSLPNGPWDKGYQPSGVPKEMLCKWYCAGECKKGLPGTKCELKGCAAWEENRISVYDLGRGGVGIMQTEYKKLSDAALALVDAVERYMCQECLRSELLNKNNELKNLLK